MLRFNGYVDAMNICANPFIEGIYALLDNATDFRPIDMIFGYDDQSECFTDWDGQKTIGNFIDMVPLDPQALNLRALILAFAATMPDEILDGPGN